MFVSNLIVDKRHCTSHIANYFKRAKHTHILVGAHPARPCYNAKTQSHFLMDSKHVNCVGSKKGSINDIFCGQETLHL